MSAPVPKFQIGDRVRLRSQPDWVGTVSSIWGPHQLGHTYNVQFDGKFESYSFLWERLERIERPLEAQMAELTVCNKT